MAKVRDWFSDWVPRHIARHPRSDWPAPGDPYWDGFRALMIARGVTETVADAASTNLMEQPPKFLTDQIPGFMKAVKEVWQRSEEPTAAPSEREGAELASKDCQDCGGGGIAVRFRRLSANTPDSKGKPRSDAVQFYCRCPMGRWIELNHRTKSPELRRRFYDLENHVWLWGNQYRYPPGTPEWMRQDDQVEMPI